LFFIFWADNLNLKIHPLLLGFLTGINVGWMDEFHGQHCYDDEPLGLWGAPKTKKKKNKKTKNFQFFFKGLTMNPFPGRNYCRGFVNLGANLNRTKG